MKKQQTVFPAYGADFMETDKALVERYTKDGDIPALELLVERYRKQLYSFIINMISRFDDADDVFQETWFRAVKSLQNYRHDRFLSWLFRIAHNIVVDKWRKNRETISFDAENKDGFSINDVVSQSGLSPGEEAGLKDAVGVVGVALNKLPREQREVFLMRVQGDLSFREIAKIQSVSINTALARMSYAVAKLRKELHNEL